MGIEGIALKDHCQIAMLCGDFVDAFVVEKDIAGSYGFQSCKDAEGCGLPAAGWTKEDNKLTAMDLECQIVNDGSFAESFRHIFDENRHAQLRCRKGFSHSPQASAWGLAVQILRNRFNGLQLAFAIAKNCVEKPLKRFGGQLPRRIPKLKLGVNENEIRWPTRHS